MPGCIVPTSANRSVPNNEFNFKRFLFVCYLWSTSELITYAMFISVSYHFCPSNRVGRSALFPIMRRANPSFFFFETHPGSHGYYLSEEGEGGAGYSPNSGFVWRRDYISGCTGES